MRITKRLKTKTTAVFAALTLSIAALFGSSAFLPKANAADDTEDFSMSSLGLANSQFTESSSAFPGSPTSWTSDTVGSGNVIAGVVDLSPSAYHSGDDRGNKKLKLDKYPEYGTEDKIPATPFGKPAQPNTDAKTLIVNTVDNSEVIYSYRSADMTFAANSFYRVSAWVKTGSFKPDTGATVKLIGLDESCAFTEIDTVKALPKKDGVPELTAENNFGWVQYTFYVRTSASLSKTVKLSLGIGNAPAEGEDELITARAATGYAFFDTVEAYRISAFEYTFNTGLFEATDRDNVYMSESGTSLAIDLYDSDILSYEGKEIGTFSDNFDVWKPAVYDDDTDSAVSSGNAMSFVYDSAIRIKTGDDVTNKYGFSKNPLAPLGSAEYQNVINNNDTGFGSNGNIYVISTYNTETEKFDSGARGIASPDYTIKRYGYYRFSVWVKSDSASEGSGVTIGVRGTCNNSSTDNVLTQWYSSLAGDESDTEHYGWKEQVVYIRGSLLNDNDVHFELWFGSPSSQSAGIAMFDNVTFTELDYSEFSAMSAADGGNVLNLDNSTPETGVTNGSFSNIGDYEELTFPLPVADWTSYAADQVQSPGFSTDKVNTDNVIHGIVPTDDATFDAIKASGAIPGINNPKYFLNEPSHNVLVISSSTPTAYLYRSPSISVSTGSAYKITADIAVDGVRNGYGASLVLKTSDGNVISTIENITDTKNEFVTYTFYLDAPLNEQSVYLEIWLGLNDRAQNSSKLSDGNVYVKQVGSEVWSVDEDSNIADEYAAKKNEYFKYANNKEALKALKFAVYSFSSPSLDYYDVYSYNADAKLGTPYGWSTTVKNSNPVYGMFNSLTSPYDGFESKELEGNMLYLFNTTAGRTEYTFDNVIHFAENTYYKLEVDVKVLLDDESIADKHAIGANIALTGSVTETFENIKDTSKLISQGNEASRDKENFVTYTFYIASGDNGGDIGLTFSLGGNTRTEYISGKLVIGGIRLASISNTTFEAAEESLDKDHEKAVRLSEADDDEGDDGSSEVNPGAGISWWIIPTVIVSACMVAAIVLVLVMRLKEYFKNKTKKKSKKYNTEYDRSATFKEIERLQAHEDNTDNNAAAQNTAEEHEAQTEDLDTDEDTPVDQAHAPAAADETEDPDSLDD